ncbi:MAG: uncharacterized protein KVP18_001921 [Porospora cf. gigantea A]|uniref:uncharacterized protein n=1 Tax=Porospora cf. gigantea A TaxID=2853593 RepID=UPI003559AD95|nr:MAG: hypothetical protein KVP18_001921 [Porospora cf. gigantea A]
MQLSASAYHVMCRADNAHPTCIEPPCHQAQKGNGCFDLIQAWYARYCEYPVCRHFEEFEGSTDEVDCFVRETDAPTRQPDTETATTSNSTTESSLYVTPAHKIGEKTVVAGGFAGAIMGSALMLCVNCQPQHLLAAAEMVEEVEDMLDDHVSSDRQRAQQVLDLIQKSAELEA